MIYHVPFALDRKAASASGIRPVRMYEAFKELGYKILLVSGTGKTRRKQIREIKRQIQLGKKIDFVYSETATIPTSLTDPKHLPPHLLLDILFFRFCRRRGIPVGVFYRDIYWVFSDYVKRVGILLSMILGRLYRWDLWGYKKYVNRVYLPSDAMAEYVPIVPQDRFRALPPGAAINDIPVPDSGIHLLYVGGFGAHYQFEECVRAVSATPGITLTVCTPESQWQTNASKYDKYLSSRIKVVHSSGAELKNLYREANVCLLYVKPSEYWEFAQPVKLYEYMGYGRPIIASTGTLVGEFIRDNNVGWAISYSKECLIQLLKELQAKPEQVENCAKTVSQVRMKNTWLSRAQQVRDDLLLMNSSSNLDRK